MSAHRTKEITVLALDEKEHPQGGRGARLITFHVKTTGGPENDVEVISKIMPLSPSVVLIQPGLIDRQPISVPDKLVTMMGNIWNGGFQFKYRRVDCTEEPEVTYRFDFLVID
ncbi:hypothetical protein Q669_01395 [Labrenzia sp. C1B10]|uniref:hypothetical protein n=1 Tax=unclassified Labrenzia TaxID=2648686 RepID=UPI0003B84933|nr:MULTISPECIES: hypothetical protein [unclassified Labrenzia]ERP93525.1 hypothetical protein Q669_01395 [Labrenzia sp. C1B10]ERS05650.1 hypothetical protein Q675_04530 [Labrenzia sp. C1B70]